MNLTDEIEQMMLEYSIAIEITMGSNSNSRRRNLKCGFCTRTYKYDILLVNHIYSKEI